MPVPWNDDDLHDRPLIENNLRVVLRGVVKAAPRREPPAVATAQEWHRRIYRGVRLPIAYYAGEVRDDDPRFPELIGYEVRVGDRLGAPSREVPGELVRFEASMRRAVRRLDAPIPVRGRPGDSGELQSVLTLCALGHGEWVRIHPFANGNGRIGRLWANWCALRYGLPPFVRLKPRPEGDSYTAAAADSMRGDHRAMVRVFASQLDERLNSGG